MEAVVLEMQEPKTGVKSQTQRLVITTIPHAITGEDIVEWISNRFKIDAAEAQLMGTLMVSYGYIYPLQDYKRLIMKADTSLYRFQLLFYFQAIYLAKRNIRKKGMLELHEQEQYNHLHKWMNHKWDFIVMQAKEQYRAGKERKKPDRVVFDCQERAYWVVHRPPPGTTSGMDYGLERLSEVICINWSVCQIPKHTLFGLKSNIRDVLIIGINCMYHSSLVKYTTTYKQHDPILYPCLPSNPWLTDDVTYWDLNKPNVENPTRMRVERWTFSFGELLSDPRGRADFRLFLKKEFSGENLAFWEACEDLKWGAAATMQEKAQQIYKTFLARGAPRWINIDGKTMEITVILYLNFFKDSYGRYLKSPVFKDTQIKAVSPETVQPWEQLRDYAGPSSSHVSVRRPELEGKKRARGSVFLYV
uniref:Regulator of G protein signaling 9a n=1 Tax=Electrophorus electricus TaxID=8005 RepID=A0AAY5E992_ELEEL